ncbi:response regulator [Agrilactobacillus fermenti]|uniref:response regulator transcription factor n=1 Tax=Agrilactobacillus fermenti TaxID=2586909 RepID=UPI001E2D6017|nr:response regulator transcription factor [Agrilactobacillus fermenti]MCD2256175.1 response regulator transcription factor [Agrilactobacillus fermenti]
MVQIVLAEDQSMLNTALAALINLEDDFEVVATFADGQTAWQFIQAKQPDVAILDIEMPKMTGLDVAEQVFQHQLKTKVIILTTFAQTSYFKRAVAADISGYLLKDKPSDELMATIRKVMQGETVYDAELVKNMFTKTENPLSQREMEVLQAAASGQATKAVAAKLFLSDGTVRNYMSAIISKLGVHNRMEALNLARKNKWL